MQYKFIHAWTALDRDVDQSASDTEKEIFLCTWDILTVPPHSRPCSTTVNVNSLNAKINAFFFLLQTIRENDFSQASVMRSNGYHSLNFIADILGWVKSGVNIKYSSRETHETFSAWVCVLWVVSWLWSRQVVEYFEKKIFTRTFCLNLKQSNQNWKKIEKRRKLIEFFWILLH